MKRKLLTLVLAGAMVCSLAACGGNNNSESSETSADGRTQMSIALRGGVYADVLKEACRYIGNVTHDSGNEILDHF